MRARDSTIKMPVVRADVLNKKPPTKMKLLAKSIGMRVKPLVNRQGGFVCFCLCHPKDALFGDKKFIVIGGSNDSKRGKVRVARIKKVVGKVKVYKRKERKDEGKLPTGAVKRPYLRKAD